MSISDQGQLAKSTDTAQHSTRWCIVMTARDSARSNHALTMHGSRYLSSTISSSTWRNSLPPSTSTSKLPVIPVLALALIVAASTSTPSVNAAPTDPPQPSTGSRRGMAFWLVLVANLSCDFLSAFDLTAISTALPTIVERLHGSDFIWAGSAYALAATAVTPLCGGLASIFGRKPILLLSIAFFALGAALCGSAKKHEYPYKALEAVPANLWLRSSTAISSRFPNAVVSQESWHPCGHWHLGPPIGGAIASTGHWRWIFFLNLPICAVAATLVVIFLRVKTPKDPFLRKFSRMDWLSTAVILAFTFGGVQYAWNSVQVLAPLIIGLVGLVCFFLIEKYVSKEPTVPWSAVGNRTSLSGYAGTFVHGIVSIAAIYYLPVYFQAVQHASAIRSGIDMFGITFTVAPFAILAGASVEIFKRYRPQNYVGWIIIIVGFGILTLLDANSHRGQYMGYQVVIGVGLGINWIATQFPILAPLPYSNNAHALAFFTFTRYFAQSWGVAIGGMILQNSLSKKLPAEFYAQFPAGAQLAYAAIPKIKDLSEPLKTQVRVAFADSMKVTWQVMIGISGAGLLSVLFMREVTMRSDMDDQWGLKEKKEKGRDESQEVPVEHASL
ncbi:hypothetical protein EW146_g7350 [Bondarzewia mesenterica]|uniref:Major facilitator superfamily (MFS) profile domain-containing protein n=1 Tax=Bondarzewia mesenterica TaxID=1095465 RepID=A0A4S4LL16_9AGAM|nr:hypothetical protein EW146_g7350 [Bondarzewia mesenterica]